MKPQWISFLFVTALCAGSLAQAQTPAEWLSNLKIEPGVFQELGKFPGLPASYIQEFPIIMKQKMLSEMSQKLNSSLSSGNCTDQVSISFPNRVTAAAASQASASDFESQIIRIESQSCLSGIQSSKAANVYLSADYQKNAFDTVVAHDQQGNRICQATEAFGLGRSEYCYNNSVFERGGAAYIHSFNSWNQDPIQAPVYYREMLTASVPLQQGTLFYTLVYVRGVSLNSLFKSFAKSKIKTSQEKAMDLLGAMARNP